MNDPFEYAAVMRVDMESLRKAFREHCITFGGMTSEQAAEEAGRLDESHSASVLATLGEFRHTSGIVCCSANPLSNRMWAHYADCHRGVCIGYRTELHPFWLAMEVLYEDPNEPLEVVQTWEQDVTRFCDHVSRRKGKEWDYEEEYRIPVGPIPEDHTRILPLDPGCISEIRLGVRIDPDFKEQVLEALRKLPEPVRVIQMGCDFDRFSLTEEVIALEEKVY
mgnify:CR=1 FL=1|jgi:hypothetical protein